MAKVINITKEDDYTIVEFENNQGKKFDYEFSYDKKTNSAGLIRNGIDYAGLWFEGKTLVDYDMVFELTKCAIITIRKAGFKVPRDFEPKK